MTSQGLPSDVCPALVTAFSKALALIEGGAASGASLIVAELWNPPDVKNVPRLKRYFQRKW